MDGGNAQPQPTFEVPKQPGQPEHAPEQAPEQVPGGELPSPSAPPSTPVVTTDPASLAQPAQPVIQDKTTTAPSTKPTIGGLPAEDADLIEKQWVDKAKKIVDKTRDDPYAQNQEISKVKAEYISKRFNKQIKLPEDNI